MGRIPWIKLALASALGLVLVALLLTLPQSGMAQPAGPGAAPAGLQSPVVHPLLAEFSRHQDLEPVMHFRPRVW